MKHYIIYVSLLLLRSPGFIAAGPLSIPWSDKTHGPDGPCHAATISLGSPQQAIDLYPGGMIRQSNQWALPNELPRYGNAVRTFDEGNIEGYSIPNFSLNAFSDTYQVYPGGKAIETTFVPSYVHEHDDIRLYSNGVHIGSVPLGIPESLVLGGYGKNRVLGDVSTQSYSSGDLPIDLLNLKIGMDTLGLLHRGNTSINYSVTVFASGANPYIYLPHITCEDIAAELPITHHPEYGLYFWNTEDKRYSDIVSAPTYLGFTFSKNGLNNAYITINVPFSLLNLTLEAPLAVFVGVNLGPHQGSWFLAYAPGRNIPGTTTVVTNNPSDSTVVWKELPTTSASITSTPIRLEDRSRSSGFSMGAKTSTAVGVAAAAIFVICCIA
ncbi:hypothetical protein BDV27DRAFT_149917 [Aspergillus caelatus]|uniref:Aspartic peptidase domain-containing protein n=1 Tax=Aspergillus caelatus TaxID=61420 RepID=A0A5N6ZN78_9EURO|nr:uncharacterized protein BDV27DRAFT_149917 [Aspergillus caelatus]KAE8359067.1 hypothetical protein BDV27DRAFT_149917 [Aspergillus caelatus]